MSPDLIDSVELERTVNSLNQKLVASRKAEEELRAQLQELERVDELLKQVGDDDDRDGDARAYLHCLVYFLFDSSVTSFFFVII